MCLGHMFGHWKSQGLGHLSESEINVVVAFIFSLVELPEKDKINPRVYSENSNITQPCVLKTV